MRLVTYLRPLNNSIVLSLVRRLNLGPHSFGPQQMLISNFHGISSTFRRMRQACDRQGLCFSSGVILAFASAGFEVDGAFGMLRAAGKVERKIAHCVYVSSAVS